ncbi:hypothetical protein FDA33_13615 [Clostridium botulinum]|nr:hypothetical protein [Clostridium botulinum]NFI16709.1 hypothetical protein [Clostridium botulinum]NFI51847.1 hypothetical protein [Clostridium botulinum]NFL92885.1 hypothetical protein [Clostridium botulinum]NFN52308.1 hypothetical protein [Clostridium botulinum]
MDFSVGNLVKSVVGAVAKVATAVVNALSPVAQSGGILGGIAGAIVGVAEAVLGVTAEFADVCEDGEIDDEEAEELLEDVFKLLVGAFIGMFGSDSLENDWDDDMTSDHICYIFYQPGIESGDGKHSFDEQAEIEKEKYKKKYPGTEVALVPVTNPHDFKEQWHEMDDKSKAIDAVQIILHGSINDDIDDDDYAGAGFMYFEDETHKDDPDTWWYRIATDTTVIPDQQKQGAILISDLDKKKINELYFSSCNSANPDAQNTASAFEDIVDANEITGWDGGTVYSYNDKEREKSEEVAGGEGSYRDDDKYGVLPQNSLAPAYTTGQPTWWRYVSRDSEGWPTRKRQGKVRIK